MDEKGSYVFKSPLKEADKIVNSRSEERDREYGGFTAGMIKTAKIATELCGKEITTEDAFKVLMALKLSRLSHSAKFDSMVDLIGYTEGWWNAIQAQAINNCSTGRIKAAEPEIKEAKEFIEFISKSVGEVITEYHWREACGILLRMETKI